MLDSEQKFPKVTVGAVIINQAGKVFLMRSPEKFANRWYIPGGHVDWGESIEQALAREVKEETGLTVGEPEFIRPVEFIFSPVYDASRHIIPLDYAVKTSDAEDAVKLDGREGVEYVWLNEGEVAQNGDIEPTTKETILLYFQGQHEQAECASFKTGWQRALADYQNLKKETEARRAEWAQYSEQMILEEFIPVYDNFKKAFNSAPAGAGGSGQDSWRQGIGYIMKQFGDVLKAHGVEEIKTVGEKFDLTRHESVGEEAVEGKAAGEIAREVEGGYTMGGRVIKVAKVVVAK